MAESQQSPLDTGTACSSGRKQGQVPVGSSTHLQLLLQAVGAEQDGAGVGAALPGSGVVGAGVPEVAGVAPAVGVVVLWWQACGTVTV
jgi:hypothetical protein